MRETLRAFADQEVDGAWFGRSGRLTLPTVRDVAPYRSADGQVEVDALAETVSGELWAVELKWQNKVVVEKELTALAAKARTLNARPWCVSRSGFTPAARAYVEANNILISTRADLEKIERTVRAVL